MIKSGVMMRKKLITIFVILTLFFGIHQSTSASTTNLSTVKDYIVSPLRIVGATYKDLLDQTRDVYTTGTANILDWVGGFFSNLFSNDVNKVVTNQNVTLPFKNDSTGSPRALAPSNPGVQGLSYTNLTEQDVYRISCAISCSS